MLLKIAIATLGVGTYQIASLLVVTAQQVSRLRNRSDIKLSTMLKICKVLQTGVEDFLHVDES